jgi:prepilin signal peptidase PulO-like enzyme (type II secretory pathway)
MFVWLSRGRAMGEGDPAVGFLMGAVLGWPMGPISLLLAFICGGFVASVLLLTKLVSRKTAVPFVPFLAVGATVAYWGREPLLQFLSYAFF